MSNSQERLVQGTLDEVLREHKEEEAPVDPLGEKPIGRTPTGLPIYPSEPSDAELRRKLSREYYAKKAQAAEAEERLRQAQAARRAHTQSVDATMRLKMGKRWGRGNR